jgi:hypothetical protein
MKPSVLTLLFALSALPCTAADYDITTTKPADQIKSTSDCDKVTFDISCPSGIGGGKITLAKGKWPDTVILRIHLTGLEFFSLTSGKLKLSGSVLSHSGNKRQLSLSEEGKEGARDAGAEIKVFDAAGKPVKGLPGKGGYFEIPLPKAILDGQPKSLEFGWIDFYR